MKKLNVAFSIDLDDRDSIRDALIKLNVVTAQLKERWRQMEVET